MAKPELCIKSKQFDPQKRPWPKFVIPWDKTKYQPRDCSWGYIECENEKVHVLAGDWIITFSDKVYLCRERDYEKFKERAKQLFKQALTGK